MELIHRVTQSKFAIISYQWRKTLAFNLVLNIIPFQEPGGIGFSGLHALLYYIFMFFRNIVFINILRFLQYFSKFHFFIWR